MTVEDDSVLDDDMKRLLQTMADPCSRTKLTAREQRAITQAINEIHGWRERVYRARHLAFQAQDNCGGS